MHSEVTVRTVTRFKSTRRNRFRARLAARREEKGYVMVMTAILLPLLLILVSAATDVTYFYARGVEVQRLADTAALAGVVRMPNLPNAKQVAKLVAKQNAAEHNVGSITVDAEAIPGTNRQIKVTVRDSDVKLFFGRLFKDSWDIKRTATAEYISNIPLGSVVNAIGSGDLTGTDLTGPGKGLDTTAQNFWLTVHGPCAAKEQGDQFSTRYDGTYINASVAPGNDAAYRFYRVCDYDSTAETTITDPAALFTSRINRITAEKTAAPTPGGTSLFPAVSLNRDYDAQGYNYIVDVPCSPVGGVVLPAPCPNADTTSQDLWIEVFDPVFDPDSLQYFETSGSQIKPDGYGVRRMKTRDGLPTGTSLSATCRAAAIADPTVCTGTVGAQQYRPADVRVTTDFRVYGADDTPVDYTDDVALELRTKTPSAYQANIVNGIDAAGNTEVDGVAEFRSCINATDGWSSVTAGGGLAYSKDLNHDHVPDGVAGATAEPETQLVTSANCDKDAQKWRPLVKIAAGQRRGKYRVNVRTVSSQGSFGANAFSVRAAYGPTTYATTNFAQCKSVSNNQCPSVSGDSTMSVSASVPSVSEFYLAQLAPAALFRGKTVVLSLWDIGEGGDQIEVLRPIVDATQCADSSEAVTEPTTGFYCKQRFNWNLDDPGVNDPANPFDPLGTPMGDPCNGTGQDNQLSLSVAGHWDTSLTAPGCGASISTPILTSRSGFAAGQYASQFPTASGACALGASNSVICQAGRFNDRLVTLQIQVPLNYGCNTGTGPDAVTGVTNPANPCVDQTTLAQGGWWKIRYTPLRQDVGAPYIPISDATTWGVQLIGDPVHLVQNG